MTKRTRKVKEACTVRGHIILPTDGAPPQAADVIIQVEDISRADAPSMIIGEQHQTNVSLHAGAVLPFCIEVPAEQVDKRRSYSVRVHVDVAGSGQVKVGDLVSTQTYPVLTHGYGDEVQIGVRRV
jgi:putative lipoprotein